MTKNEQLRNMRGTCLKNQLKWRYVLADSWFFSAENMKYIHESVKKYFILALKSNRHVALSLADKKPGRYVRIDALTRSEAPVKGWVKGLAKSPAKTVRTQSNHIFMPLYASTQLEC